MKPVVLIYQEQLPGDPMKEFVVGFDYVEDAQPLADQLAKRGVESMIYVGILQVTMGEAVKSSVKVNARPIISMQDIEAVKQPLIMLLIALTLLLVGCQVDPKPANKVCYTCHETKVASTKHSAIVGDSYITVCGLKTDSLYFTEERMLNDSTTYWHEWSCVKKEQ